MFLEDQADRGGVASGQVGNSRTISPEQMSANDAARRKRAHQLLEQGALRTGSDFYAAAFIFQHGEAADDYLLAHVLATAAIARGEARARWIGAATLDRFLHSIGQSQIFGTQSVTLGYLELLNQRAGQAGSAPPAEAFG